MMPRQTCSAPDQSTAGLDRRSIRSLCPVIEPACLEHSNTQAAPNSSLVPKRFGRKRLAVVTVL
jgi:hypothetical protein